MKPQQTASESQMPLMRLPRQVGATSCLWSKKAAACDPQFRNQLADGKVVPTTSTREQVRG